ncbi:hypothetical protein FB192DRAFT_1439608 [Mucor lusitanicus]|uniref:W2 domain-containing protein n=1 Tax=Mucor circinelloides f. lusitanicus TaxID=29924 RepID=A0A8H4EXB5_MUCCL|nr:hypothetical protein FB192DRAFT_1439608 [Mucor lusitanicus]
MNSFNKVQTYPDDEYNTIQQNIIDLLDSSEMDYYLNDKSLAPLRKVPVCIAAAVYRMSAGNCMPYTGSQPQLNGKPLQLSGYQRNESPWESYKHKKKAEDASSCSTLGDSTCSSRSDSPEPKRHSTKKRSYHMLLREIRRLRGENSSLRTSVSVLKNDLRDITLSRQDTDASHKRFYDEYLDKNTQLEIDLMDRDDEITHLKQQIEDLKLSLESASAAASAASGSSSSDSASSAHASNANGDGGLTLHDAAYFKRKNSNIWGCYEFEEDENDNMSCQPVAHESALPEINVKMDELKTQDDQEVNDYFHKRFMDEDDETTNHFAHDDEDDEDDQDDQEEQLPFDQVAASYIHQAILSKLSSARVRLEFDDLILKHEPSSDTIASVLAHSFVQWMCSLLVKFVDKSAAQPTTATKVFTTKIQTGIVEFWESILQYYTTDDESQIQLLNHIETELDHVASGTAIVDHFDRLILMLYKYHVVDDEAVIAWWQHPFKNEVSNKIRKITTKFVDWVQDEDDSDEEESDEECDDEDMDDVFDDEVDNDDDDEGFSFVESPVSEQDQEAEDGSDNDMELNHHSIDDLLITKDRELCVCQLDNDTSNTHLNSKHEPAECSCSTYTPPPPTEKKKKSVRIAM